MGASELNEVAIVQRELEWRIGELERALQIRSELFAPVDAQRAMRSMPKRCGQGATFKT